MMLGEISPGGTGSTYGALVVAIIAVFIAGLMVGGRRSSWARRSAGTRSPQALYTLTTPALVLVLAGLAIVLPVSQGALLAGGPHGLTEMVYAFTSAANNNGSAFAGLSADQPFLNLTLALAMALGRFVPMVLVLALAGRLVAQKRRPATAGTMPTHTPLFVTLLVSVALGLADLPPRAGLASPRYRDERQRPDTPGCGGGRPRGPRWWPGHLRVRAGRPDGCLRRDRRGRGGLLAESARAG
jgi:K+-transporting ATPase ATPase A chain